VFHLSLCFITFGGHSAHLAYQVDKSQSSSSSWWTSWNKFQNIVIISLTAVLRVNKWIRNTSVMSWQIISDMPLLGSCWHTPFSWLSDSLSTSVVLSTFLVFALFVLSYLSGCLRGWFNASYIALVVFIVLSLYVPHCKIKTNWIKMVRRNWDVYMGFVVLNVMFFFDVI